MEIIQKSGDGGEKYLRDKIFLVNCFVWGGLTNDNNCVSQGEIVNQYCFYQKTFADKVLRSLKLNDKQRELLKQWKKILNIAKAADEYISGRTYGLKQLNKEINVKIGSNNYNKKGEEILKPKYVKLDEAIKVLREETKLFYNDEIVPKLFEYELLK